MYFANIENFFLFLCILGVQTICFFYINDEFEKNDNLAIFAKFKF